MAAAQTVPSSTASDGGEQKAKAKKPAQGTPYIVLRREQVTIDKQKFEAWVPVMDTASTTSGVAVPKVFKAPSKQAAIRQHTGDGADVVEGTFKAVPLSSWRGGLATKRVTSAAMTLLDD